MGRLAPPVPGLYGVHQITLPTPWKQGPVQAYAIDRDPLTLIDVGLETPDALEALKAGLEELGHELTDIRRIVVTHYHRDHVGQVQALRELGCDLELCAHEDAVPMVEHFSAERDEKLDETLELFAEYGAPEDALARLADARRQRLEREPAMCRPTRVDRLLRGSDRIPFKDMELEVIHAPGHTAGHILLHEPTSRVLFSGDHLMNGAVPNTENYYLDGLPDPGDPLRRRPRFKGLVLYRESLRELRRRSFSLILPSFGRPIRAADRAVRDALLYYDVRIQRIERSLRSVTALGQSVTGFELWRGLFPNEEPSVGMKTKLLMVIGALDVLEESGACVTERRDDGVLVHRHSS